MKKRLVIVVSLIALFLGVGGYCYERERSARENDSYFIPPEWILAGELTLGIVSVHEKLDGDDLIPIFLGYEYVAHPLKLAEVSLWFGADVDGVDRLGRTALILNAGFSSPEGVGFLLAHGADPNREDAQGNTALQSVGVIEGHGPADLYKVVWQLLAAGADPCHRNCKGETPATHFGLTSPLGHMLNGICSEKTQ